MITVTLPDNKQLSFSEPTTILQIAKTISNSLAKVAIAGCVDDKIVDLSFLVTENYKVKIITEKDPEALNIIRHSCAHLMAHAVKQIFPDVQITIGPVIKDGFYYDFAAKSPFTLEDFDKIEKCMHKLVDANLPIMRKTMQRDDAIAFFENIGEQYKAEIIADNIPQGEEISLYEQGDFIDLCRGPHVPSTKFLKAFKLTKLAGAYWRGDANNEMLQRIYGTAWASKEDLNCYLNKIEEVKKRDHRKIGKAMHLFHVQEEGPGMVFWHNNGWQLYQTIAQYIRAELRKNNYQEVNTPMILDRTLWEKSGHWSKFGTKNMFITQSENREYVVKPMNCPGAIQIFNHGLKSYRDLPLRLAEFGSCHRNEPSGTLHGIMRVRGFVQDDAHIFCAEADLQKEVSEFIDLLYHVYKTFGFTDVLVKIATRPEQRVGSEENWDKAEKALEIALNNRKIKWELAAGEGAFYGPKIEFSLCDCLDRVWQCGTIQVDFAMPERLGAEYVAEDGSRKVPVMLHRVILGSLERFVGILLEHYAGCLPFWLAPVQVVVLNITDAQADYADGVVKFLQKNTIQAILDLRNEKIGFKIREHTLQKVPFMVIIGDKEMQDGTISVRGQAGKDFGTMGREQLLAFLQSEINLRSGGVAAYDTGKSSSCAKR